MKNLVLYFIENLPNFKGRPKLKYYFRKLFNLTDRRKTTLPGGRNIWCNLSEEFEASLWYQINYSPVLEVFKKILQKGDTYVDCGAHIGTYSLFASSIIGTKGKIFAFEPHPKTFTKLKGNFDLNSEVKSELFNKAVSNKNGTVNFLCHSNPDSSHISNEINKDTIQIGSINLDSILPRYFSGGIKLDIEGQEYNALQGGLNSIRRNKPWIAVEFNTDIIGNISVCNWDVYLLLKELGYIAYLFDDYNTNSSPIDKTWTLKHGFTDLLFICK